MKRRLFLSALLAAACCHAQSGPGAGPVTDSLRRALDQEKRTRTYLLHIPHNLPTTQTVPLVLAFHGGGGDGAGMERLTGFSALADREGFIVAYPDGVAKHWNDGRGSAVSEAHRVEADDVGFVEFVIADISRDCAINPRRVYATGISNGGIFCHYLAARLAGRIAAIAPVVGGIAQPFAEEFKPAAPVSVFMIQGTNDPLVPYHGGGVLRGRNGSIISTEKAAQMWVNANGCETKPITGELADADPGDNCRVNWSRWPDGKNGTEVVLYTIEGGGHTWPGGPQYLAASVIGRVCRDFDATRAIWEFFKKHSRK